MKKIILLFALFLTYFPLRAEVSPLPEIHFNVVYNTQNKPLINPRGSELINCKDRLCMQAEPLGIYGSQRMQCGGGICQATAYEFDPFAKLILLFEDGKTRSSEVFALPNTLISKFNVFVEDDNLQVEPIDTPPTESLWKRPQAWGALALILLLELICGAAYVLYTKKRFTILYGVAIANVITAIFVWALLVHWIAQSAIWWIFAVISEAVLIWVINRKDISLEDASVLSIMTNVTSYTLGMIISFAIAQM